MDGRTGRHIAGRLGASAVGLALVVAGCSGSSSSHAGSSTSTLATTTAPSSGSTSLQDTFVALLGRVRPSVVEIATDVGLGSGVVYDTKGDIVTNAHVVGSATTFKVSLVDGRTLDGTLVGAYAPDDLAVIKVSASNLPAATLADSSKTQVGDIVLAIGNPLGLASSVTEGIVSATGRTVSEGGGVVLPSTIQTSAPINPGNSGGALVDLDGDVLGIPTLAAVDQQLGGGAAPGIGFAIPSNTVKMIADQLIASGKVTNSGRAALGITGATALGGTGQPIGVLVRSVQGPAASAGIGPGDIITAVDGKQCATLSDLQTILAGLQPNQRVTIDVTHPDGKTQKYDVTLGTL